MWSGAIARVVTVSGLDDGSLSTDELITYMLKEYGGERALRLLSLIDTNSDGTVSREEWHAACKNGDFHFEIGPDSPGREGGGTSSNGGGGEPEQKVRLLSKHLTRKNLLPPVMGGTSAAVAPNDGGKAKR